MCSIKVYSTNRIKMGKVLLMKALCNSTPFLDSDHALAFIVPYKAAKAMPLPHFKGWIPAGFPSPVTDWTESTLDLNEFCIDHPAATYFVRVHGNSMKGAGICSGDILIVEQAVENTIGRVVLAIVDGAFTVKRLITRDGAYFLKAEDPEIPLLPLGDEMDVEIRGVVTWSVHPVE